ncbi:FtsQ-type POTRA domain-containing protein [bacterium]|nr:FtsQ-type POTRA domain-containing protein [bacterium]
MCFRSFAESRRRWNTASGSNWSGKSSWWVSMAKRKPRQMARRVKTTSRNTAKRTGRTGSMARRSTPPRPKIGRWLLLALLLGTAGVYSARNHLLPLPWPKASEAVAGEAEVMESASADDDRETASSSGLEDAQTVVNPSQGRDDDEAANETAPGFEPPTALQRLFRVGDVTIDGCYTVSRDTVRALLGELEGRSMTLIHLDSLAERVGRHPRVRHAVISRQLPKKIQVDVVERYEEALVMSPQGLLGVDRENVLLPPPRGYWELNLPVITGAQVQGLPGDTVESEDVLEAMRWVNAAASSSGLSAWLTEVHVTSRGVELVGGETALRIMPGRHAPETHFAALEQFLDARGPIERAGRILDMRYPEFIILKPVQGEDRPS